MDRARGNHDHLRSRAPERTCNRDFLDHLQPRRGNRIACVIRFQLSLQKRNSFRLNLHSLNGGYVFRLGSWLIYLQPFPDRFVSATRRYRNGKAHYQGHHLNCSEDDCQLARRL